jgi:cytochrome b561
MFWHFSKVSMTNFRNASHRSRTWHYSAPAIVLHWLLAVLLTGMVALGWYMMAIEDEPGSDWYFSLHKSFGLLVLTLVLCRLLWRLMHRPQPLPAAVPRWQQRLAGTTQALLYGCMLIMPLTGLLGAAYSKDVVSFFGLPLPLWATPDHDTQELFFAAHGFIAWLLVGLVALHVAGALKHWLVNRDNVIQRMWFGPQR